MVPIVVMFASSRCLRPSVAGNDAPFGAKRAIGYATRVFVRSRRRGGRFMRTAKDRRRAGFRLLLAASAAYAGAIEAQVAQRLDPLVVTATRIEERAFDLPVAIDSIDQLLIQRNQLQLNLSETLVRVPGVVVAN